MLTNNNRPMSIGDVAEARAQVANHATGNLASTRRHVIHRRSEAERMSLFFSATAWQGTPVNREPHKCSGLDWHELAALPTNMVPYVRHAITAVRRGEVYSEFGWK